MAFPAASRSSSTGYGRIVLVGALAVSGVFLVIGVLGFLPGITTNYDMLSMAGHQSGAMLLGMFQVSVLHNIVHLLFGMVGVMVSVSVTAARRFLFVGGLLYAVLWAYGLFAHHNTAANVLPVNTADNWLHLGLAVAMVGLAVLPSLAGGARSWAPRQDGQRS